MKTVIYFLLAITVACISVVYLNMMGMAIYLIITGFALACALGIIWLIIQARLEEIDLKQRLPEYSEYMKGVPRFIPRIWQKEK